MSFLKALLAAICFLFAIHTYAMSVNVQDSSQANQLFSKGEDLLFLAKHDSSVMVFEQAASIYAQLKRWDRVADCTNMISENYWRQGRFDRSLSKARKALKIYNSYEVNDYAGAKAYTNLGQSYVGQGHYEKGLTHYNKAVALMKNADEDKRHDVAIIYSNIGRVLYVLGKFDEALESLKKGLAITADHFGKDHLKTSFYLNNIGNVYYAKGEYIEALKFYEKTAAIKSKAMPDNNPGLASTYGNIATINQILDNHEVSLRYYRKTLNILLEVFDEQHPQVAETYYGIGGVYTSMGEYDLALKNSHTALDLVQENYGSDHPDFATKAHNIGLVYSKMGNSEEAIKYCERALKVIVRGFGEENTLAAKIYNTLADIYLEKSSYSEAIKFSEKSLTINKKIHEKRHPDIAISYNIIGVANQELGQYEVALDNFRLALKANAYNTDEESFSSAEIAFSESLNASYLLQSLVNIADCLSAFYEQTGDIKYLEGSIKHYQMSDSIATIIQSSHVLVDDKLAFSEVLTRIFDGAINANQLMYDITGNELYVNSMFNYSERNKSSVLKSLIQNSKSKKYSGVPDSVLLSEKRLKMGMLSYKSSLQKERSKSQVDSADVAELEDKLFSLNREYENLLKALRNDYPDYYNLKHRKAYLSVDQIQKLLGEKTTLLEYYVGDEYIYTFVLSADKLQVNRQTKPTDLLTKIEDLRTGITQQNFELYTQSASQLYSWLVKPVMDEITNDKIIVVPDGSLWHVNFDLLLTSNTTKDTYKSLSYLLRDYAISYAYAAELLDVKNTKENAAPSPSLLAFSFGDNQDPVTKPVTLSAFRETTTDDLPGSRAEVRAIAGIFDGKYYYGQLANEASFKANSGKYSILHLALHGEIDDKHPDNSKLIFTPERDSIEDGYLHAYELYNMSLKADLAVLSACNTNSGKVVKGEGIMSLGRAFTYAGCKSLLLTQWKVSDATTPEIIKTFYKGLKKGLSKSEALQQAKLEFLTHADNLTEAPVYWGSFVLLGDVEPLEMRDSWSYQIIIFGSVLLLLTIILILRKRMSLSITK